VCAFAASTAHAQIHVEAGVENYDWREHTTPIAVHEHGPRFSFAAGVMQPRDRGLLFAYRGELYGGNVDYNGSFQFDATKAATGGATYLGTTQRAEARWRWPATADAVLGVEYETWKRELSAAQEESYRTVSVRLGVEHMAGLASRVVAGGGIRFLVATGEDASITDSGIKYALALKPGLGSNPYLTAGYRVVPHVTVLGYWDGMSLGRSNQIALLKRGKPKAFVSQPDTDVTKLGVRVAYGW
jgi:hypothetical protein